jgi:hypothetical protein
MMTEQRVYSSSQGAVYYRTARLDDAAQRNTLGVYQRALDTCIKHDDWPHALAACELAAQLITARIQARQFQRQRKRP